MKKALGWIKSNFVIVVSSLVIIASVGALFTLSARKEEFVSKLDKRIGTLNEIDGLMNTAVDIPAAGPDDRGETMYIAINQATIDKRLAWNEEVAAAAGSIVETVMDLNKAFHEPMLEDLLPTPANNGLPHRARGEYRRELKALVTTPEPGEPSPYLNAGLPPQEVEIEQVLDEVEQAWAASMGMEIGKRLSDNDLNAKEQQEMILKKQEKLIRRFRDRAKEINVYANTDMEGNDEFPFTVGAWSVADVPPEMIPIWEGQMQLWIYRDIVRSIMLANRIGDPTSSVITAPVKHLKKVEIVGGILKGWVGLNSEGGVSGDFKLQKQQMFPGMMPGMMYPGMMPGMMYPGMMPGMMPGGYPGMPGMTPPKDDKKKKKDRTKIEPDYKISPSGRNSNEMYDVYHVSVEMYIDAARLIEVIEAFQRVSLQTVVDVSVSDVDEYLALKQGYFYGDDDVVKVSFIVESVWLRDWLDKYMPDDVKELRTTAEQTGQ